MFQLTHHVSRVEITFKHWGWAKDTLDAALSLPLGWGHEDWATAVQLGCIRMTRGTHTRDLTTLGSLQHNLYLPPRTHLTIFLHPNRFVMRPIRDWHGVVCLGSDYMVLDKPPGIPTVPTNDNKTENLVALIQTLLPHSERSLPPLLTSRLDLGTHGLLMFARHQQFQADYNNLLSEGGVDKWYECVVVGWQPKSETKFPITLRHFLSDPKKKPQLSYAGISQEETDLCLLRLVPFQDRVVRAGYRPTRVKASPVATAECPLHAHLEIESAEVLTLEEALECRSLRPFPEYAVRAYLDTFGPLCRLRIKLLTGRTHQIRAQVGTLGAKIVGDYTYGFPGPLPFESVVDSFALACTDLQFVHPDTSERVEVRLPEGAAKLAES
eukprot:TRINITY_DN636_c0_g1_i1.p1 TRINITY_DN636_c0_g1~~TRINITY_DN636_c0_g1_i1.p1  ORF type:complete len:394 (+),score=29.28 TRINITY_DN636_c0_g1_i1:37-1182(+)